MLGLYILSRESEMMYSPSIAMYPSKCVCIHASVPQWAYPFRSRPMEYTIFGLDWIGLALLRETKLVDMDDRTHILNPRDYVHHYYNKNKLCIILFCFSYDDIKKNILRADI